MFKLAKICSNKFHHLELDDLMGESPGNDFYPLPSKMHALAFLLAKSPQPMVKVIAPAKQYFLYRVYL